MRAFLLLATLFLVACVDTTGGGIVGFTAAAAGAADLPGGQLEFSNNFDFDVTLTKAVLHVGSIYLNENAQPSIERSNSCIQQGIYVGEVFAGLDVDILNPNPQPIAAPGNGLAQPALEGEVWLNGDYDINQVDDTNPQTGASQVILTAEGTASKGGTTWPFQAAITIGKNRLPPIANPALPGNNPICTQRVVNGLLRYGFTPENGGALLLRIDPRVIFGSVKFDALTPVTATPPLYQFSDDGVSTDDIALFDGIVSRASYTITFENPTTTNPTN